MSVLTRYDMMCHIFPERRAPFALKVPYYTNAPFSRSEARYSKIKLEPDVIHEFFQKAHETKFAPDMKDVGSIEALQYEKADVTSVMNDPIAIFLRKEDLIADFPIPPEATQAMVCIWDVHVWQGDSLVPVEGVRRVKNPQFPVHGIKIDLG